MANIEPNAPARARDEFERYYTEKIWDLIPAVYKDEDGQVLRAIVEVLAHQAAVSRRSIDRLWEDQFIELCDDWAIPYIGDLLGTRLVHELNRRGRRVDVARTIFYRRRKGTPLVLEALIQDITRWQGVLVEGFRRLARTVHGLDPEPSRREGLVTGTSPGGWARLTDARGAGLVDMPFDEFFHTADVRRLRGKLGRYNISKLNFHLFRIPPFEVNLATAAGFGGGRFTFDPSGRNVHLFAPDQRPNAQNWSPAPEWQIPAPLSCRLLGEARYRISADLIEALGLPPPAAEELSRFTGVLFRNEARLRQTVASLEESAAILAGFDAMLAGAITDDSPKAHLVPTDIQPDPTAVAVAVGPGGGSLIGHQQIAAGDLGDWGASLGPLPPEKVLVIDPVRGRFFFPDPPAGSVWIPVYHYGLAGEIGAGTYDRRDGIVTGTVTAIPDGGNNNPGPVPLALPSPAGTAVFEFRNSKTYEPQGDVAGVEAFTLQAANFERPYVRRTVSGATEWAWTAEPKSSPEDSRTLTLSGIWIGIEQEGVTPAPEPCPPVPAELVLDGVFDRVVIRNCTLDPGGEKARINGASCQAIPYVRVLVRGNVEELVIESSIVGPIGEDSGATEPGRVQRLLVRDSIVQSVDAAVPAIATVLGRVELQRATVFGDVAVNRLFATEALIQGLVRVTDNQHGCFRFSATNDDPAKRLPQQFRSHFFEPAVPNHFFVSRRFGDPGFAQLSDTAAEAIVRGAETGSEIGAFSRLLNPILLGDLGAKVDEFMPFGLIAQYIRET